MAIEIVSNTILKPFPSPHPNSLTNAKIPLTIFDKATFDCHIAALYVFRPPMPTNETLKTSLSQALNYFPHLAGRLILDEQSLEPCILINNAGVRVIETRVSSSLDEILPLYPSTKISSLHPPQENHEELLHFQINQFNCGGVVLGMSVHHRIADGESMSSFIVAWSQLARGATVTPLPYHDRKSLTNPRNHPTCRYNHLDLEFCNNTSEMLTPPPPTISHNEAVAPIENLVVHFSADFIKRLKIESLDQQTGQSFSTFECLLAHMWKKMTLARRLEGDEVTNARVAVSGRYRIKPAIPREYFGNLVLWAHPTLKAKDLLHGSYSFVANMIHEAVAEIDDEYFKSFIDFGHSSKGMNLAKAVADMNSSIYPNVEVDSWLGFKFHEIDFGGGSPCAFLPAYVAIEGLMLFVPSCTEKGGVDVVLALHPDHVASFKRIVYSLGRKPMIISKL